jgi:hypothetical protein
MSILEKLTLEELRKQGVEKGDVVVAKSLEALDAIALCLDTLGVAGNSKHVTDNMTVGQMDDVHNHLNYITGYLESMKKRVDYERQVAYSQWLDSEFEKEHGKD